MSRKTNRYCIAYGCLNNDKTDAELSFFCIPKDTKICEKWLKLLNREDLLDKASFNNLNYRVCSAHFRESSFKKGLKRGSIPIRVPDPPEECSSDSDELTSSEDEISSECKGHVKKLTSVSSLNSNVKTFLEKQAKDIKDKVLKLTTTSCIEVCCSECQMEDQTTTDSKDQVQITTFSAYTHKNTCSECQSGDPLSDNKEDVKKLTIISTQTQTEPSKLINKGTQTAELLETPKSRKRKHSK